jgi:hypothetical protein
MRVFTGIIPIRSSLLALMSVGLTFREVRIFLATGKRSPALSVSGLKMNWVSPYLSELHGTRFSPNLAPISKSRMRQRSSPWTIMRALFGRCRSENCFMSAGRPAISFATAPSILSATWPAAMLLVSGCSLGCGEKRSGVSQTALTRRRSGGLARRALSSRLATARRPSGTWPAKRT